MSESVARAITAFELAFDEPSERQVSVIATACADDPKAFELACAMLRADEGISAQSLTEACEAASLTYSREFPAIINEYRVYDFYSATEYCEVYVVETPCGTGRVALKTIRSDRLWDNKAISLLERELDTLRQLDHPRIVHPLRAGRHHNNSHGLEAPYFTMPLIDGQPLDVFGTAADTACKLRAYSLICQALTYSHRHGIVHCDLSPRNILVDRSGVPTIIDFGAAERLGENRTTEVSHGTGGYLAPERFDQTAKVDVRWDVYALGVLGHLLFAPECLADRRLTAVFSKACAIQPERRHDTVSALMEDWAQLMARRPVKLRLAKQRREATGLPGWVMLGVYGCAYAPLWIPIAVGALLITCLT